jgi:gliding motility associated protien GldN
MNILNKFNGTLGALLLGGMVFAQNPMMTDQAQQADNGSDHAVREGWKPSLVKDGVIDRVPHINKAVDMYSIREVDVAWKRRVWQQIDVKQKKNQPFIYEGDEYTGGGAFIEILIDAVKKGKIAAYNPLDDAFTTPMDLEAIERSLGGSVDSELVIDPITLEEQWTRVETEFNVNSVSKYQIKEDWLFDRNAGRMVVRIIGIAPLVDRYDEGGNFRGSLALFWLYYPDLRKILANYEVYNPLNDINRISWSDYFDNRYFDSYVIRNSANNPTKRKYDAGLRGLEEAQRDMEKIYNMEMDMWEK